MNNKKERYSFLSSLARYYMVNKYFLIYTEFCEKQYYFLYFRNSFRFLKRDASIFDLLNQILSKYVVFINPYKIKSPQVSEAFDFFSKFSKYTYIFRRDENGNWVFHVLGLKSKDLITSSLNDFREINELFINS